MNQVSDNQANKGKTGTEESVREWTQVLSKWSSQSQPGEFRGGETRKGKTVKAITEPSSLQVKAQNRKTSRGKVKVVPGGDLQDGGE